MQWTVKEILDWVTLKFVNEGLLSPRLDAQLLICHALCIEKIELYTDPKRPLSLKERDVLRDFVRRRLKREPIAYILNKKHWYNLTLFVDKRVLIPRPETEVLLDFVIKQIPKQKEKTLTILDLCTGSGCLALALAESFKNSTVVAVDNSKSALEVANMNITHYGYGDRVKLIEKDVTKESTFAFLKDEFTSFDIVVSNPPYVSESEYQELEDDVKNYEPKEALIAKEDGLFISKTLMHFIQDYKLLSKNALFIMELGVKQAQKLVSSDLPSHPYTPSLGHYPRNKMFVLKDLEEKDRFLVNIISN